MTTAPVGSQESEGNGCNVNLKFNGSMDHGTLEAFCGDCGGKPAWWDIGTGFPRGACTPGCAERAVVLKRRETLNAAFATARATALAAVENSADPESALRAVIARLRSL